MDLHFCIFCVLLANIHIFHDFIFPHLNWVTFFPIHDTVPRHSFWLLFYLECFRVNVRTRRCEKDLKLIPLEEFQTVQIWIKGSLKERNEMTETRCFLIIITYNYNHEVPWWMFESKLLNNDYLYDDFIVAKIWKIYFSLSVFALIENFIYIYILSQYLSENLSFGLI